MPHLTSWIHRPLFIAGTAFAVVGSILVLTSLLFTSEDANNRPMSFPEYQQAVEDLVACVTERSPDFEVRPQLEANGRFYAFDVGSQSSDRAEDAANAFDECSESESIQHRLTRWDDQMSLRDHAIDEALAQTIGCLTDRNSAIPALPTSSSDSARKQAVQAVLDAALRSPDPVVAWECVDQHALQHARFDD